MSEFDVLYYTDCRPGQGQLGGAGFQFQASTPQPPPEAEPLVQGSALYEPPAALMRKQWPVKDYPRSLAHIAAGELFVTSAGCYLGQEANGTREGNQFTHAIVTTDVAAYGLTRPAQLWAADWWVTRPAPTTVLAPMPADPLMGPWDAGSVRDRIARRTDAEEWLTALLSAVHRLDDPDRRPVLIVAADPAEAACWVAAATLLLPQDRAMRVSFKIFAANVEHSRHDIVAVHPEWGAPWSDVDRLDFVVFDLETGRRSPVEATDAADFWASRFLHKDPFDTIDAVEYAGRFARDRGEREAAGPDRIAGAVVALGEPVMDLDDARMLADWLARSPARAPVDHSDGAHRVVAAVLAAAPDDPATLRHLWSVVVRRGPGELVDQMMVGLFRTELAQVLDRPGEAGPAFVEGLPELEPPPDGSDAGGERVAWLEAELARARPQQVGGLLSLATRHHLRPAPGAFSASAARFTKWWIGDPHALRLRQQWVLADQVLDWVRQELASRLTPRDVASTWSRELVRPWWRYLWSTVTRPDDPLDRCVCGLAYVAEGGAGPARVLDTVIACVRAFACADPALVVWEALFCFAPPAHDLAALDVVLARLLAIGWPVSGALLDTIGDALAATRKPSGPALGILDRLATHGAPMPAVVRSWRADDVAVRWVLGMLRAPTGGGPAEASADQLGHALASAATEIVELYQNDLADRLLDCHVDLAVGVVLTCGKKRSAHFLRQFRARWPELGAVPRTDHEKRSVALAFLVLNEYSYGSVDRATSASQAQMQDLGRRLEVLVRAMPGRGRKAVNLTAPRALGATWGRYLDRIDGVDRVAQERSASWLSAAKFWKS